MIRVLLVDDHAVLREGLRLLLEAAGIEVVGEAGDGQAALQEVARLDPDIAVMDIGMPIINGIDAMSQLRDQGRRTRVILLSMHQTEQHVREAIRAGAWGYVLKGAGGGALLEAIKAVAAGRKHFSAEISAQLAELMCRPEAAADPMDSLTTRERQVLSLVVEGRTSADIASLLFLSVKTVETYRSRLMQKLGVDDVVGLIKYVLRRESR